MLATPAAPAAVVAVRMAVAGILLIQARVMLPRPTKVVRAALKHFQVVQVLGNPIPC